MIQLANKRFKETATTKEGTAESIPFENDFFSKVSAVNTIYFWPDLEKGLEEIKRVLKSEGVLAIGFSGKSKMKHFTKIIKHKFHLYEPQDIQESLELCGFRLVNINPVDGPLALKGDYVVSARK